MLETKKIQIAPKYEQSVVSTQQAFGWHLVSSQEVKTKDSHLEKGKHWFDNDTIYSVTETDTHVNLLFERDTNMPHYAEIVALENEYNSKGPSWVEEPTKEMIKSIIKGIGLAFLSAMILGILPVKALQNDLVAFAVMIGTFAVVALPKIKNYSQNKADYIRYKKVNEAWRKRHYEIPDLAMKLLD